MIPFKEDTVPCLLIAKRRKKVNENNGFPLNNSFAVTWVIEIRPNLAQNVPCTNVASIHIQKI